MLERSLLLRTIVCRHFTTIGNHHIHFGLVIVSRLGIFDLVNHVHAIYDFAKHHVLTIQMRCFATRDKELATVRVGTG